MISYKERTGAFAPYDIPRLPIYYHSDFIFDRNEYAVIIDTETILLTSTEYRLLDIFAKNPNQIFSEDILIARAMGEKFDPHESLVRVHIKGLRKKIQGHREDVDPKNIIQVVRGKGYRLNDPLRLKGVLR